MLFGEVMVLRFAADGTREIRAHVKHYDGQCWLLARDVEDALGTNGLDAPAYECDRLPPFFFRYITETGAQTAVFNLTYL